MARMKNKTIVYFIILAIFLYFFLIFDINFHGADEPIYHAYTESVVENGDLNPVDQVYRDYGRLISVTYNLPDFHSHGGVVFWAPFYGYAKLIHFLSTAFGWQNLAHAGLDRLTACAMSFSTVLFGFLAICFSYFLCKSFFNERTALWSTLAVFLGTPYFYFMLFEVGNPQILASLLSVISILLCGNAQKMKKRDWFVYGLFFSICVAVRTDLWYQIFFIFPFFMVLAASKKISWVNGFYFIFGFAPGFLLRAINAYLKFGNFRIEELFYFHSYWRYKTSFFFNGLFNSFHGIFYTSPVFYICLLGIIFIAADLFKKNNRRDAQLVYLFILSVYSMFRLLSIGSIFSPAGDSLSARLLLADVPILIILFGRIISEQKSLWINYFLKILTIIFIFWNLLIIAEYMLGVDWFLVGTAHPLSERLASFKHIIYVLAEAKDLNLKLALLAPLILFIAGIVFWKIILSAKRGLHPAGQSSRDATWLRRFNFFTYYLFFAYFIITLFNLVNNKVNVQKLKERGFFENAEIIPTPLISLAKNEEEEHLWTLFKMRGYYALQGKFFLADKVKKSRAEIFGKQARIIPNRYPTDTYSTLTDYYKKNGRFDKAIECYRQAIQFDPDDFEAYLSLGDIYRSRGRYAQAIECYLKSIQLNPESANNYSFLADAYLRSGQYQPAIDSYLKSIQLDPGSAESYRNLAAVYGKLTNYTKQIEYLNKALQINPDVSEDHSNLASAYANISDYPKAISYYLKAIQLNPYSQDDYSNLANLYYKASDYPKAISYYLKVLQLDPGSADAYLSLGHAYNTNGDKENALKQVIKLRQLNKNDLADSLEKHINP